MARIYVGNLPLDIRTRDIEDLFFKYGRIRDIDLKTPARPPAFAFVSFEYYEDARDAVDGRDGVQFEGARLRVEMSRGGSDMRGPPPRGGGGRDYYDDRRGPPPRRGGGGGGAPPRDLRRSDHRVIVSGLPTTASWQDLKDFFRQAGDVIYTDVDRHGGGIVEFASKSDQEYAISKLDDTEFTSSYRNQDGKVPDKSYVRVKKPRDQLTDEERDAEDKEDKRDRSRGRKDSRSRSRSRSRRSSRSRSRSPRRSEKKEDDDKKDDDDKKEEEDKKDDAEEGSKADDAAKDE